MKILAIGDFHGKVPSGIKSFLRKNPVDFIVCTGDLADTDKIREMEFNNWDKIKKKGDFEKLFKSKKDYVLTYRKVTESMRKPVEFLGKTGLKTFLIWGNSDYLKRHVKGLKHWKYDFLEKYMASFKNIELLHRKGVKIGNYNLVGFSGYRPYSVKKGNNKQSSKKFERQLEKLLSKYRKNVILVTHDVPYGTEMDKVKYKASPAFGEHVGDRIIRKALEKYKPLLHVCGHMHENQGKEKIGKTLVVNPGYARNGEFAIIKLEVNKIDIDFHKLN